MNMVWIVAGLLGVAGVTAALVRWHGRGPDTDLGSVSEQWVAEHRLSQQHDPQR